MLRTCREDVGGSGGGDHEKTGEGDRRPRCRYGVISKKTGRAGQQHRVVIGIRP